MKHQDRDFRKNHYWHIRNFSATGRLPRTVIRRRGKIRQFLWYQLSDRLCSGREGHCFGLSVAAVENWHRRRFAISKVEEVTPKLRDQILKMHVKQMDRSYLLFVASLFFQRKLFAGPASMKAIVSIIDREGCALVNVVSPERLAGHTVVAYDYEKNPNTGFLTLYVADPNHPWKSGEGKTEEHPVLHPSTIRLIPGGAGLYYKDQLEGCYKVLFGVPYQFLK